MDKFEKIVQGKDAGTRLDSFLVSHIPDNSRSFVQKLIKNNLVSVNKGFCKNNYRVKKGDRILITIPKPQRLTVEAADIPLDIVYEDDWLVIVNKPAGMAVHPAPGNRTDTLVNALLYRYDNLPEVNGITRPGIVHRLDKDTTGLLVVAKNERVHRDLAEQFKERSVNRRYIALVKGTIEEDGGTIEAPIGRHLTNRKRMAVVARNSRYAVSHFEVIKRHSGYTLVEVRLETGRTHQIRVHMHYIGHPVIGDTKYGSPGDLAAEKLMLHAAVLGFVHPKKKGYVEFEAPLPEYFQSILKSL